MSISLVAGLGNPGPEYARTRHNFGWLVLEALALKHALPWRREASFEAEIARWIRPDGRACLLVKPLSFMNESGRTVGAVARYHRITPDEVAAAYDDVGLDFDRIKVTVGGGPGGHNGVASLIDHLGAGFVRFRLGIGPRHPPEMDLKDYVLSPFPPEQLAIIEQKLPSHVQNLELLLDRGADQAMNQLNRKEP